MSDLGDIILNDLGSSNEAFFDDETVSLDSDAISVENAREHLGKRHSKEANVYRKGPAPLEDTKLCGKFIESTHPGALGLVASESNDNASKAGSSGLLSYFSKLATSPPGELIDVGFIDSLLRGGADINVTDQYGQTIMHEVVRQWHVDVAKICRDRFVDIDKPDNFGRSPLHLASAINYPEMIEWLVKNGADIHRKTKGELQTPMHYAAKNNSLEAMRKLLDLGADMMVRDFKKQMPLFVAAEAGRTEACRFLLDYGAPVGIYNDTGISALSIMIEKMPDVAKNALEQFQQIDNALRRKYYYLNYLELETWRVNETERGEPLRQSFARSPLQAIVLFNELNLVTHPVILSLIQHKWNLFGRKNALLYLCINFFYTLIWTGIGVTMPRQSNTAYYSPLKTKWWRMMLEAIGVLMTLFFIVQQFMEYRREQCKAKMYNEWKIREIERDLQFCHPKWPEEKRFLMSERSQIGSKASSGLFDAWRIFEWFTYIGIITFMVTRAITVLVDSHQADYVHRRCVAVSLIFIWLRLMKYCRAFQSLGPFITMLGHVIDATIKFAFLFFEIFIPYCCAFWILFGEKAGTDFEKFQDLIYQVFMMTLVADYEFVDLTKQDKIMAQILVGTYLAIAGVVCLNLYIALMSETFSRVWIEATANAYMSQASHLLTAEAALSWKHLEKVHKILFEECSPLIIQESSELGDAYNEKELILALTHKVDKMNAMLSKSVDDTDRLCEEVDILRNEVTQLRKFDEGKFGEIIGLANNTSLAKIRNAITTVQEGVGAKIRKTLFSREKRADDIAVSQGEEDNNDDDYDDDAGKSRSFFSKKK